MRNIYEHICKRRRISCHKAIFISWTITETIWIQWGLENLLQLTLIGVIQGLFLPTNINSLKERNMVYLLESLKEIESLLKLSIWAEFLKGAVSLKFVLRKSKRMVQYHGPSKRSFSNTLCPKGPGEGKLYGKHLLRGTWPSRVEHSHTERPSVEGQGHTAPNLSLLPGHTFGSELKRACWWYSQKNRLHD